MAGLRSFWIEFEEWPESLARQRVPPFPRECGVTATDVDDALALIRAGFYENRELPPIASVTADVSRAPGRWAGGPQIPAPTGRRGIWHPIPFFPDRTVIA